MYNMFFNPTISLNYKADNLPVVLNRGLIESITPIQGGGACIKMNSGREYEVVQSWTDVEKCLSNRPLL